MKQVSLGKPAVFLLPSVKLKNTDAKGKVLENKMNEFLMKKFGAYTVSAGYTYGYWKNAKGKKSYGEYKIYSVAFPEKSQLPVLMDFIAGIARDMAEESVYMEYGDEASLIYGK